MPYQFGAPFDVAPYPDVDLPEGSGDATSAASMVGASLGAGSRTLPARRNAPTALELAEGDASRRELAVLATASRRRAAANPAAEVATFADAMERLETRRDLERDMRVELLDIKRDAAEQEGAPETHIVALTQDEIDEIRGLVDAELPADGVDYLPQDDHASVTMARGYGGFIEAAATASLARHVRGRAGRRTQREGTSTGGSTTGTSATGGGNAPTTEGSEDTSAADRVLDSMHRLRANTVSEDTFDIDATELMDLMRLRIAKETELRQHLLVAKKTDLGDNAQRLPTDFVICLTRQDLNAIREAVDAIWPVIAGNGVYLGDDDFASLGLLGDDNWGPFVDDPESIRDAIARRQREEARAAARDGAPTPATETPTATTTGVSAGTGADTDDGVLALAQATASPTTTTTATAPGDADGPATALQGEITEEVTGNLVETLSEIDLDRLTRRLWTRIRRELRGELLIDRERAGVLADMR